LTAASALFTWFSKRNPSDIQIYPELAAPTIRANMKKAGSFETVGFFISEH
jgi:hypothetical protein